MSARQCPNCATELRAAARFCDACGCRIETGIRSVAVSRTSLPAVSDAPAAGVEEERKTITALFADIKGSMALIEDLDPEDAGRVVDPAMQAMTDAVHRYGGTVAQASGDGIFAMFGAPIAQEDHAQRALLAALQMQGDVAAYAQTLRRERGVTLQIRVGVNTGEVVLRAVRRDDHHADYSPAGHATGLAARMEQLADPGSIVVSEHTQRITEGYFQFRALGLARVKGLTAPIPIYELMGMGALRTRLDRSQRRGLAPFVGRSEEFELLRTVLDRAAAGQGQLLTIEGEPGIGKSRLTHELRVLADARCGVLASAAAAHNVNAPYATVIQLLREYLGIQPEDDSRRRRERITGRVLTLDRSLEDVLPYLFMLLGEGEQAMTLEQMDPTVRRARTQEALMRVLLRETAQRPVLLIVEDLHWLDVESQAVLDGIAARLADVPLALVVNYRPEYRHTWKAPSQTHVRLGPLEPRHGGQLVRALLGARADLDALNQLILERTGGNPFFIEEIVRSLREQGLIGDGVASEALTAVLQVPATVHDVLAARIDRLSPADKSLLQTLAVLGREFSVALATRMTGMGAAELALQLERLQQADFLSPADDADTIAFKHALTHDVAYATLLSDRRRNLHARAASAIEHTYGARLEDQFGALARHYRLAGEAEKAVDYLQLAGLQALRRSAYADAVHHLSAAVTMLMTTPESLERDRLELLLENSLGRALMLTKGWESSEAEQVYARARDLIERVGNSPHVFPALGGLFGYYTARGDFHLARALAARAMDLAERFGHGVVTRWAHYMMAQVSFYMGEFEAVRTLIEPWLDSSEPSDVQLSAAMGVEDFTVGALAHLSQTLWYLGYPDQAVMRAQQAVARAREIDHPFSMVYALLALTQVYQCRGDADATRHSADELVAVSETHGLLHRDAGVVLRGWARTQTTEREAGITEMREGLATLRAKGAAVRAPNMARIGEALGRGGAVAEGLQLVDDALATVVRTGERQSEALLHRIRGDLWLQRSSGAVNNAREAEGNFLRSLRIAQQQRAKSLELQAAIALARLWRTQDRARDARELLAPLTAWFSEGFATADFRAATELLTELRTEAS